MIVFAPLLAFATQVLSYSVEEATDAADVVIEGRVTDVHAERPTYAPKRIVTRVTIAVSERLKGVPATQASVELTLPGGEVGRFGQRVAGVPVYEVGDDVIVFLQRVPMNGTLVLTGLAVGSWQVDRRPSLPMVTSDRTALRLLVRDTEGRLVRAPTEHSIVRQPLSELLERIRARTSGAR